MNPVIENYEALSAIMEQMRIAATQGEWERMVALEKECSRRVALMKAQDEATTLDENSRRQKLALIRKILADDAEIRNVADPWMAQLQRVIQSTHRERRLLLTYT